MQCCRRSVTTIRLALAVAVLAVLAPTRPALAGSRTFVVAPAAPWVRPIALPESTALSKSDAMSGRVNLLVDHQVRLGAVASDYNRLAWKALTTEGVQDASEIEIDFDPTCQRLVIHHVRLLRGGKDVFSFESADVKIIQQETGLDEQIYSGDLTAVIFLRDLRPGDTLDYAYTLEGLNPILNGGYDDVLWLQYESPVQVLRHIVTAPDDFVLHLAPRNTTLAPVVTTAAGWRSYAWEVHGVPAQLTDEDEPGWYEPDPHIDISSFGTWGAVARWASSLFEDQAKVSPEISRLADRWRQMPGGPLAAAAEAARFVQDEIRYLGIEMGPSSHKPHPPAQVLRQRFGDCKDKSLLLVVLLRELGIDAAPALVNTTRGRGLDAEQASAFAFDHAIVQAVIGGRTIWIDATESDKGGPLEEWDPPDFERALVLRPGTESLSPIEKRQPAQPLVEVQETFTLGEPGKPTRLDVVTTYRRGEADEARRMLAATASQDLAKKCLDDYGKDFSEIRALGSPVSRDDRTRNIVTLSESYELGTFWKNGARELYGWQVTARMPKAAASTRKAPLSVPHPVHVLHRLVVRARAPFRIASRHETIRDDAFAFSSDRSVSGRELRLSFDYRSLADSVAPERIKGHQAAVERVKDELSVAVTSDLAESGVGESWIDYLPITVLGVMAGASAVVLNARRRRQLKRSARRPDMSSGAGETASTALALAGEDGVRDHVENRACSCGATGSLAIASQLAAAYDGRRLTVLHLRCGRCGGEQDVYVRTEN
jgi:hypothetical protein